MQEHTPSMGPELEDTLARRGVGRLLDDIERDRNWLDSAEELEFELDQEFAFDDAA